MIADRSRPDSRMELRKEQRRMKYEGKAIQTVPLDGGFVELRFDLQGDSVNKFNSLTLGELKEVVRADRRAAERAPDHERQGRLHRRRRRDGVPDALPKSEEELAAWLLETDATFRRSRTSRAPPSSRSTASASAAASSSRSRPTSASAVHGGEGGRPGDEARHLPRLGRHRPPLADVRGRQRDRVDRDGRAVPAAEG
jgi:short chain enoyl-CoA hydratase (EC 4.2.1.17)/3-hydroxyacyl-CoA dehydrogenase (EC 1.1.1.35)